MSSRRIAHLDMDAFYASVELLRYPELRGQAVVIGGRSCDAPKTLPDGSRRFARLRDYAGRGVVTTSTYEARALGVFSGMGTMRAGKLAPGAILLPVDFVAYRHYSQLFKEAVRAIAPQMEDRGIDEVYLDVSEIDEPSALLAQRIKTAVRAATGLSCSIGVSPNKLLAKICSDLNKPDGVTILDHTDIPARIWPLPVAKVNGIGPKATEKLAALGITTIGELAAQDCAVLTGHFGDNFGAWLHRAAQGQDDSPVVTHSEPKSISRESTFARDLHPINDKQRLTGILTDLCRQLASDLRRKGYLGRTIGIKLRFDDFQTLTRDLTLPKPTADAAVIRKAARECLKRIPMERRIRLLGLRAGNLSQPDTVNARTKGPQAELPLAD